MNFYTTTSFSCAELVMHVTVCIRGVPIIGSADAGVYRPLICHSIVSIGIDTKQYGNLCHY